MANNLNDLLPRIVAQGLVSLREEVVLTRTVNTDREAPPQGMGDTINIPVPSAVQVQDVTASAAPVQGPDTTVRTIPLTLDKHKKTSMFITDREASAVGEGAVPLQLPEHMRAHAAFINACLFEEARGVYGYAGTAGQNPFAGGSIDALMQAEAVLNQQLAPRKNRRVVLDVYAEAKAKQSDLLVRADARGAQGAAIEGEIGQAYGMSFFSDTQVPRQIAGTPGAGVKVKSATVAPAVVQITGATSTVTLNGMTANTGTLKRGDIVSFAGHSQTYAVLGDVTASAAGEATVTLSPALVANLAADEAVSVRASHSMNLVYHRDALAFSSRPLVDALGAGNTYQAKDPVTGIALRAEVVRQNKQTLIEWDILFGVKLVRPELACRLAGQ